MAIEWTGCSLDFDMPSNHGVGMAGKSDTPWSGKTPVGLPDRLPVVAHHPGRILPRMAPSCPAQEEREQGAITVLKGGLGRDGAVVERPPPSEGGELANQGLLRSRRRAGRRVARGSVLLLHTGDSPLDARCSTADRKSTRLNSSHVRIS